MPSPTPDLWTITELTPSIQPCAYSIIALTDLPAHLWAIVSQIEPTQRTRYKRRRGINYPCGYQLIWRDYIAPEQSEPGPSTTHTIRTPALDPSQPIWISFASAPVFGKGITSTPPISLAPPGTGQPTHWLDSGTKPNQPGWGSADDPPCPWLHTGSESQAAYLANARVTANRLTLTDGRRDPVLTYDQYADLWTSDTHQAVTVDQQTTFATARLSARVTPTTLCVALPLTNRLILAVVNVSQGFQRVTTPIVPWPPIAPYTLRLDCIGQNVDAYYNALHLHLTDTDTYPPGPYRQMLSVSNPGLADPSPLAPRCYNYSCTP